MQHKRAFTLIELLIVVAIIALLTAILLPAFSQARAQSKRVRCQANLRTIGHAVQFYLDDCGDVFPDAPFYGVLGYIGRDLNYAILGSQLPESQRPLNEHLGVQDNVAPDVAQTQARRNHVFECPSDKGDAWLKLPGTFFVEHGTSYTYASDNDDMPPEYRVPRFGVGSCRGLPLTKIRYPAKKIVFQEPIFSPMFNMSEPQSQWHDDKRNHANLLFADGHVQFMFTQIFDVFAQVDENEPYY